MNGEFLRMIGSLADHGRAGLAPDDERIKALASIGLEELSSLRTKLEGEQRASAECERQLKARWQETDSLRKRVSELEGALEETHKMYANTAETLVVRTVTWAKAEREATRYFKALEAVRDWQPHELSGSHGDGEMKEIAREALRVRLPEAK